MLKRIVSSSVLIVLCFAAAASSQPTTRPAHQIVRGNGFALAAPAEWRIMQNMQPTMPLYIGGDGRGVPMLDETGAPLQIGMTVEYWPTVKKTLEERKTIQDNALKSDPRMESIGPPVIQAVTLDDGTAGVLMIHELTKDKNRHSLQIKMLVNGPDGAAWCVSGFLVGGLKSTLPVPNGKLTQWLIAHVRSFCFDPSKINEAKLPGAFIPAGAVP